MKGVLPICISIFSLLCFLNAKSQTPGLDNGKNYQISIVKTSEKIQLDGELNEAIWKTADSTSYFTRHFPTDDGLPKKQTVCRVTYDDQFLYIGGIAYDTNYYIIKTLKRDSEIPESDLFLVILDPMNERTNGYLFNISPYNVQAEDIILNGGKQDLDFSWDNKWLSATAHHETYWSFEIAIPFKTLHYSSSNTTWGINFGRGDRKNYEYSLWAPVPVSQQFSDLGFNGSLLWDKAPVATGKNINFIPYGKSAFTQNKQDNEQWKAKIDGGFDVKAELFSSMNLDLTFNPDFSQVEVDEQVTNLTRFNIFFPEKRTFFLENADLFTSFGAPVIKPFYSRTIGLDQNGNAIPILGGARLTGNITPKTRIGVMNIQTSRKDDVAAQNYSAFAFNHSVLKRSLIKGYFLNRQAFSSDNIPVKDSLDNFGRNAGLQFNYSDSKGLWNFQGGYHLSFKPGINDKNKYYQLVARYTERKFNSFVAWDAVSTNYYTDMGFVNRINNYDAINDSVFRLGFKGLFNNSQYSFYPTNGNIINHGPELNNNVIFNPDGTLNERSHTLSYIINFKNSSVFSGGFTTQYQNLQYGVKFVSDNEAFPLPPAEYYYNSGNIEYNTDTRKLINAVLGFKVGEFYNGTIQQYQAKINFRKQPWGNFSLNAEYNKINFPADYGSDNLFLVASRVEICFSTQIFWTTFVQYNTQFNNLNINSRLQWRFKPMSDIYLVYSDNYFTDPLFKNKNRGIIIKMNWWISM